MSNYLEHCKNIIHLSSLNNIFTEHCKNITQACGLNYKYAYLHTQNCQKYYLSSLLYKLLYHCKKYTEVSGLNHIITYTVKRYYLSSWLSLMALSRSSRHCSISLLSISVWSTNFFRWKFNKSFIIQMAWQLNKSL